MMGSSSFQWIDHMVLIFNRHYLFGLLIVVALLAMYYGSIIGTYGYADDYPMLTGAQSPNSWFHVLYSQNGRIFLGWYTKAVFQWAGSIEGLRFIRLSILLQLILMGWLVYAHLFRINVSRSYAALIAVLVVSLPPFEIMAAWAGLGITVLASALTYPAYRLITLHSDLRSGRTYIAWAAAITIMWVVFNIYQPSAMFFWFWVAADVLFQTETLRKQLIKILKLGTVFAISGMVYFTIYKAQGLVAQRTSLAGNYLEKAVWFITDAVPSTFNFHFIEWPIWTGALLLLLCIVAIVIFDPEPLRLRLARLAIVLVLLVFSYTVNLVVGESCALYRTRVALMSVAALILCYALCLTGQNIKVAGKRATAVLLIAVAMVATCKATYNVLHYIVFPQVIEYSLLRSQLRHFDPAVHRKVYFIPPPFGPALVDQHYYMEFGTPSSCLPAEWGIQQSMVVLGLQRLFPDRKNDFSLSNVVVIGNHSQADSDPTALVVDLHDLSAFR